MFVCVRVRVFVCSTSRAAFLIFPIVERVGRVEDKEASGSAIGNTLTKSHKILTLGKSVFSETKKSLLHTVRHASSSSIAPPPSLASASSSPTIKRPASHSTISLRTSNEVKIKDKLVGASHVHTHTHTQRATFAPANSYKLPQQQVCVAHKLVREQRFSARICARSGSHSPRTAPPARGPQQVVPGPNRTTSLLRTSKWLCLPLCAVCLLSVMLVRWGPRLWTRTGGLSTKQLRNTRFEPVLSLALSLYLFVSHPHALSLSTHGHVCVCVFLCTAHGSPL